MKNLNKHDLGKFAKEQIDKICKDKKGDPPITLIHDAIFNELTNGDPTPITFGQPPRYPRAKPKIQNQ